MRQPSLHLCGGNGRYLLGRGVRCNLLEAVKTATEIHRGKNLFTFHAKTPPEILSFALHVSLC